VRRCHLALTLTLAVIVCPVFGLAQNAGFAIKVCDNKDSATWIQQSDCGSEQGRIIAWPLFSFPNGKDPQAMPLAKCLSGGSDAACGLDAKPHTWWLGPVKSGDSIVPLSQALTLTREVPRIESRIATQVFANVLRDLERQLRLVELAWRLGPTSEGQPKIPILRLPQTIPSANAIAEIGDCRQLSLGELHIKTFNWSLTTRCQLPVSSGLAQASVTRLIASGERPFQWDIEANGIVPTEEIKTGEHAQFFLFPYELDVCKRMAGAEGYRRAGVPHPAQSSKFLLSVDTAFHVPELGKTPEVPSSPNTSLIAVIVKVAGALLLGAVVWAIWRFLGKRGHRFPKKRGHKGEPTDRPRSPARFKRFWARFLFWKAPRAESVPVKPRPDTGKSEPDPKPIPETVLTPAVPPQQTPASHEKIEKNPDIKDLGLLVEGLKAQISDIDTKVDEKIKAKIDALRLESSKVSADKKKQKEHLIKRIAGEVADEKMTSLLNLREKVDKFEGQVNDLKSGIGDLVNKEVERWSHSLLLNGTPSDQKPGTYLQPDGDRPPIFDSKAISVLHCLDAFSDFALGILKAWLSLCNFPLQGLESSPLGALAALDFKALQGVVHCDRLLWAWCLGRIPQSSPALTFVRLARRKWLLPTGNQVSHDEMSRIGLQWADERLPRMQTIIEATPFEWGGSDPMYLREALKKAAAERSYDGREDRSMDLGMSASALSQHFHFLANSLYNSADVQYVAPRLHQDSIQAGDIPTFIAETQGAFPFPQSDALIDRGASGAHGTIVRISQPITKRRDRTTGQSRWEGSLYYLEVKKK